MLDNSCIHAHKLAAINFLQLVVAGEIDEAYQRYADMQGKHHNPFSPAGLTELKKAMVENYMQFPNKQLIVKNVLGDGDLVAVHSHIVLSPGEPDFAVAYIFRFKGDKVVELWDIGQPVLADYPNVDGMF